MLRFILLDVVLYLLLHITDSNAQLVSSSDVFTFCSGEEVELTCTLTSSGHIWQIPAITRTTIILNAGSRTSSLLDGRIKFAVKDLDGSDNVIRSTMTFTASVDLMLNKSRVLFRGTGSDVPFNYTIYIFNFSSPTIMLQGNGSGFDTLVSWQDPTKYGTVTVTAGIYDGECRDVATTGNSQVFSHNCIQSNQIVSFCVVFDYMVCKRSSVQSRRLPSTSDTGVTFSRTLSSITLLIDLNDISGGKCRLSDLWVQYTLVNQESQSQIYTRGRNSYEFTGLSQGQTYNYKVQITINDEQVILPSYPGLASTLPAEAIFAPVGVGVPVIGVTSAIGIGATIYYYKRKRKYKTNSSNDDTMSLQEKEENSLVTNHPIYESEKSPHSTDQCFQDQSSIVRENTSQMQSAEFYAVPEKKAKKHESKDEQGEFYAHPDKSKQRLNYADIDVADTKQVDEEPKLEYATVLN